MMAVPYCLALDRQEVARAFSRASAKTGKRMAARIAIIAMTTRSSIRVNPDWRRRFIRLPSMNKKAIRLSKPMPRERSAEVSETRPVGCRAAFVARAWARYTSPHSIVTEKWRGSVPGKQIFCVRGRQKQRPADLKIDLTPVPSPSQGEGRDVFMFGGAPRAWKARAGAAFCGSGG